MAIRKILTVNDEFDLQTLRKVSKPVTEFNERLVTLLEDMKDTLKKAQGAGISAVQIGVLKRACLIEHENKILELINPVIIAQSGKNKILEEGCLSVPKKYGKVERPENVTVKAQDRFGKDFVLEVSGFSAKAVCHELDHLDGILYIDKLMKDR